MPYLTYRDSNGRTVGFDLPDRSITIGRSPSVDLVLSRRQVSRRHATLERKSGACVLTDLGSRHGTFVNRVRVETAELNDGDSLRFGDEVVTFSTGVLNAAHARSPAPLPIHGDWSGLTGSNGVDTSVILVEQDVEAGALMQAMKGARQLDVELLSPRPENSLQHVAKADPKRLGEVLAQPASPELQTTAEVTTQLLALVRIGDELRRCSTVQAVCEATIRMVMRATRASRGVIALRNVNGVGFVSQAQHVDPSDRAVNPHQVRISSTFVDRVVSNKVGLIARDTGQDEQLAHAESVAAAGIRSIMCAPLWDRDQILGYMYLDSMAEQRRFRDTDLELVSAIAHHAGAEINRLQIAERLRDEETKRRNLARFVSADVIELIEKQSRIGIDPTMLAQETQVTIMFADLQGFTKKSEAMKPADLKRFLGDYLSRMTEIIVDRQGGTLDKYIGDGILALFGAPFSAGFNEDARKAVVAATEMLETVKELRATDPEYADANIRIGINTGRVVAGMLGSARRLEYTVIGDAVNVASRLESIGEAGRILIGEMTYEAVREHFDCEFAGERPVRNRKEPVRCYWVGGPKKT